VKPIAPKLTNNLTDKQMESSIATMLLAGVTLSAILVFFGGILYVLHAPKTVPNYGHFSGESTTLRSISGVLRGAIHLDAKSVIELGVLFLIATPIIRVAFCVVGFARQRDRLYVVISASVFVILIYSLIETWL
jgi:uncharacterized membrane protein